MLPIKGNLTLESKRWTLESWMVGAERGWGCGRCLCGDRGGKV